MKKSELDKGVKGRGIVDKDALISFILRVGLAVVFFYAAVAAFLDPLSWIGFIPLWMRNIIPESIFLAAFSIYQLVLGLWLLSNKRIYYAAFLSVITMLAIIFFDIGALDIVFRDITILLSAIALAVLAKLQRKQNG